MTPGFAALLWCQSFLPGQLPDTPPALLTAPTMAVGAVEMPPRPSVVVICPEPWRQGFKQWAALRESQGYTVRWLAPAAPVELQRSIRQIAARDPALRYVLLVGDVPDGLPDGPADSATRLATFYARAQVTERWGSTASIPTDTPYGNLDEQAAPELAVGRLAVHNLAELDTVIGKVIAYEQNRDCGLWRRQFQVTAGTGGFGPVIDGLIEMAARRFLTDHIPASYETELAYANWRSPYCPPFSTLPATTLRQLRMGATAWVYIGHGLPDALATRGPDGQPMPLLTPTEVAQLQNCPHPPVALMLACYALAYDARYDCLGEQLLKAPGGPVAVIGGSRVTMPYALAVLSEGLLDEWFEQRSPTVGDLLLAAKRHLAGIESEGEAKGWLTSLARLFHPHPEQLQQECEEHLHLIQLLGDPLLTIRHPEELALEADGQAEAGGKLTVRGEATFGGRATVELVCRRDRLTFVPPLRVAWSESSQAQAEMQETMRKANDRRWTALQTSLPAGTFELTIEIPAEARGPSHVRLYVEGENRFAVAWSDVLIRQSTAAP